MQVILFDAHAGVWVEFHNAVDTLVATSTDDVARVIDTAERRARAEQLYAAGFVTYEAASGLQPGLATKAPHDLPLVWFTLFRDAREIPGPQAAPDPEPGALNVDLNVDQSTPWQTTVDAGAYASAIERIRDYLAAGHSYQVNYSLRLRRPLLEAPRTLFARMVQAQGNGLAAFVDADAFSIASASHELFFSRVGDQIVSRPMKGTVARGACAGSDEHNAAWLVQSQKNRAENLMITDMVRSDLGRIARTGSVSAQDLFQLERYPTLWQLTSTVRARSDHSLLELFQALFPAASITGAPKRRTMEIIQELECDPRNIYTGAIGFVAPDGRCQFNVAIRTALIDKRSNQVEYGVGGGIVWDSDADSEYRECQVKARILTERAPRFKLLETLAWHPLSGYRRLAEHLNRLQATAQYFCWPLDTQQILQALQQAANGFGRTARRVRLLVDRNGQPQVQNQPLPALPEAYRVALAPTASAVRDNTYVCHKTTHRTLYDAARSTAPHAHDVLLWNDRGEVTESCIANLIVEQDGRLITPAAECGLLQGIERQVLLAQGKVTEGILTAADLYRADRIYLVNSVRGLWPIELL